MPTSTFVQQSPGVHKGLDYGRSHNPTRWALERCVADLESGAQAFAFASGLAAISTVLELADSGSHIIAGDDMYGGTYRLFERVRRRSAGHDFTYVDLTSTDALLAALRPETRMVWVETPTNPMLKLADLEAIAQICRERGIISICDNTFASPIVQRPLEFGFDIVVHSTTKYMNGHSDVIGGDRSGGRASCTSATGASSWASCRIPWARSRGRSTASWCCAGLRRWRCGWSGSCANALALAQWLEREPKVRKVYYPGLESHPQHALARRQMNGYGGIISIELDTDLAGARRFLERCEVFTLAESLGGVESLIEHPALMTHATIPAAQRAELGIGDSLIRLSVGIEDVEDQRQRSARRACRDLTQACRLAALRPTCQRGAAAANAGRR